MEEPLNVTLSARRIARALALATCALILASVLAQTAEHLVTPYGFYGLRDRFNANFDGNIPAFFNALLLFFSAVLLACIALHKRSREDRFARHWTVLAAILLYLSFDEAAMLHELAVEPVRDLVETWGALYYAWVIPALIAVAVVALSFRRFVWALPTPTRRLVILAAAIYVGGAVGGELAEGALKGYENKSYGIALLTSFEELLEMLGVVTLIYALLSYISAELPDLRLRFTAAEVPAGTAHQSTSMSSKLTHPRSS